MRTLSAVVTTTASTPRDPCASDDDALTQVRREDTLRSALALVAGVSPDDLARGGLVPADIETAETAVDDLGDDLGAWFAVEAAALASCSG